MDEKIRSGKAEELADKMLSKLKRNPEDPGDKWKRDLRAIAKANRMSSDLAKSLLVPKVRNCEDILLWWILNKNVDE